MLSNTDRVFKRGCTLIISPFEIGATFLQVEFCLTDMLTPVFQIVIRVLDRSIALFPSTLFVVIFVRLRGMIFVLVGQSTIARS